CTDGSPLLSEAIDDLNFRRSLVDSWSTRNFAPGSKSKHDQFFDAFGKFGLITDRRLGDMLAEVASNAAAQHIGYLELMITFAGREVRALGAATGWDPDLARLQQALFRNGLDQHIASARSEIMEAERAM